MTLESWNWIKIQGTHFPPQSLKPSIIVSKVVKIFKYKNLTNEIMSLEQPFPIQRPFQLRSKEGSESEDNNAGMGEHFWTLSIHQKQEKCYENFLRKLWQLLNLWNRNHSTQNSRKLRANRNWNSWRKFWTYLKYFTRNFRCEKYSGVLSIQSTILKIVGGEKRRKW